MNVELSYDKEFGELLDLLRIKYGAEIFEIEGIGSQLDLNKFSKEFFSTKTTADASIDDNSNVGDSSIISYSVELTKPYEKLNSLYLLWKEMRRLYHTDVANNIIEMYISGDIYIHDFYSINKYYCMNYSTYDLINKGLPMVHKIKCEPPKYLHSFKSQLEQFIVIASNSSVGASGTSDLLVGMSYYVKKLVDTLSDAHFKFASEDDVWTYVKETITSLVYTLNQPFRGGIQCVTEDTEILTDDGFKKYQQLNIGDMVATFDIKTEDITYQPIQKLNISKYSGQIDCYGNQYVTPNHRVLLSNGNTYKIEYSYNIAYEKVGIPIIVENMYVINSVFKKSIEYDGIIWCPTTDAGIVIFRRNGETFISGNSAFTNVSVYDKYFLEDLVDNYIFEDGSTPDIDIVNRLQDIYLDVMNETLRRTAISFPVTTACFSVDDNRQFKDEKFVKYIIEKNKEFGFINLFSGKSSVNSGCCFAGDQLVLTKSVSGAKLCSIEEVCDGEHYDYRRAFTVFHNGSWVKAKPVKIKYSGDLYKIVTCNNKELIVTEDHIHVTDSGDISTKELSINDYLAFNTRVLDTYTNVDDKLTYEQGYFIGMFIGDGSYDKNSGIIFSLNKDKIAAINILQKALRDWNIDYKLSFKEDDHNVYFIKIYNKNFVNIIQNIVSGRTAITKRINDYIFTQSRDFRKGIIDGWYWTDGGNSNRIYSVNPYLIRSGEAICATLGIQTIIDISDRTNEVIVIRDKSYTHNYPLYCLRFYTLMNKRSIPDKFKVVNNTEYFKIKSIEIIERLSDDVYCFEMPTHEPYFTLPNGIITHNCRLRSDMESIGYSNSIGGSSTKIGSIGVTTINMFRLAKRSSDINEFKTKLVELVGVAARVNHARRTIIRKKIERGYAPLYEWDFVSLDKQFSTCGINGFYEAMCELGIDITSDDGLKLAIEIIDVVNAENRKYDKSFGYSHNTEQVPGESLSVKIALKDKILGYNDDYELYSNQFIPLTASADILERIKIQGALDSHFSGGSILHLNFDKRIDDVDKIYTILEDAVRQGVVYMAINYVLNECENGHMSVGNVECCPTCGGRLSNKFSRIVGYLSNVKNWNKVRRTFDYPNRKFYEVK